MSTGNQSFAATYPSAHRILKMLGVAGLAGISLGAMRAALQEAMRYFKRDLVLDLKIRRAMQTLQDNEVLRTNLKDFIEIPESRITAPEPSKSPDSPPPSMAKPKTQSRATRPKRRKPRPEPTYSGQAADEKPSEDNEREILTSLMEEAHQSKRASFTIADNPYLSTLIADPVTLGFLLPAALITFYLAYDAGRKRVQGLLRRSRALTQIRNDAELRKLIERMQGRYRAAQLRLLAADEDADQELAGTDEGIVVRASVDEAHRIAGLLAGPGAEDALAGDSERATAPKQNPEHYARNMLFKLSMVLADADHDEFFKEAWSLPGSGLVSGAAEQASAALGRIGDQAAAAASAAKRGLGTIGDFIGLTGRGLWKTYWAMLGLPLLLATALGIAFYRNARALADPEGELRSARTLSDIDLEELMRRAEAHMGLPLAAPSFRLRRDPQSRAMAEFFAKHPARRIVLRLREDEDDED